MVLYDYIDKNKALSHIKDALGYGIPSENKSLLKSCLLDFDMGGEDLTTEYIDNFHQVVIDNMSAKDYSRRDIQEMDNVLTIYGLAALYVKDLSLQDVGINSSWATKFYDYSKYCCDKDIQQLWSKILSIEINTPGKFFERTLEVFHNIERFELDWFYEVTRIVFDKACIPEFALRDKHFYAFNRFQTLIDLGIINPVAATITYTGTETLHFTGFDIIIEVLKPSYSFGVYVLTDAGSQLFDLRPELSTEEYQNTIKEYFEKNDTIKVVSIVNHK